MSLSLRLWRPLGGWHVVIYMFSILRSGEYWRGLAMGIGSRDDLQQTYMNWRSPSPAGSSSSIELLVDQCVSEAEISAAKSFWAKNF